MRVRRRALILRYAHPEAARPIEGEPVLDDERVVWRARRMPDHSEATGSFVAAHTTVTVTEPQVRMARLPGARTLFVNGVAFVGDPDRRGYLGVPVALREGDNHLLVVGIDGGFELELWSPPTRIVVGDWDAVVPRRDKGWTPPSISQEDWAYLIVPLFNASLVAANSMHVHYQVQWGADPAETAPTKNWACDKRCAPLGFTASRGVRALQLPSHLPPDPAATHAIVSMCAYDSGDAEADRVGVPVAMLEDHWTPRAKTAPRWEALAIRAPTALVYTTGGSADQRDAYLAATRYWQQLLWYHGDMFVPLVSDGQFGDTPNRYGDRPMVFGSPESTTSRTLAGAWIGKPPDAQEVLIRFPDDGHPIGFAWSGSADAARLLLAVDPFDGPVVTASRITLSASPSGGLVVR